MRLKVTVRLSEKGLTLPLNYREMVQAILYKAMPRDVAAQAHIQIKGHRKMQAFTFSRLLGKSNIRMADKSIHFQDLYFYVSCWDEAVAHHMKNHLKEGILIYTERYCVDVEEVEEKKQGQVIRMLSPVTVRQTDRETGKTHYFEPNTPAFSQAVYQNLKRKYLHFYKEEYDGPFAIVAEPLSIKSTNAKFENLYIKAYMGRFHLVVDEKAFDLLYRVGIGEKNAQGFGMFEVDK